MGCRKNCCLIVLGFIIVISLLPLSTAYNGEINIFISIPGEQQRVAYGNPVMVAGIWHYVNLTIENELQELDLKFYKGDVMPSENNRNSSNYYEWKYVVDGEPNWVDVVKNDGKSFIDVDKCSKNDAVYSFYIGVKDTLPAMTLYKENWTLDVFKDGEKIYSTGVVVEKPTPGIAKTHGDVISFRVDPFKNQTVYGSDYFSIKNTGNIPLEMGLTFGRYDDLVEVSNINETLHPFETKKYSVRLHSIPWMPQVIEIPGVVYGKVNEKYIILTANFSFDPQIELNAPDLVVTVAHGEYRLVELGVNDVTFQHLEDIEMKEDEIRDIYCFISGNGDITLDLRGANLSIMKILLDGEEVITPLYIKSTNETEHNVTIRIRALKEGAPTALYYDLTVNGNKKTYITEISVSPPEREKERGFSTTLLAGVIVGLIMLIIIVYMIYAQIRYRR